LARGLFIGAGAFLHNLFVREGHDRLLPGFAPPFIFPGLSAGSYGYACPPGADRAPQASQLRRKEGTMPDLEAGALAPDFVLPTDDGGTIGLSDHRGEMAVLYFYPADNTETCTTEAIDFSARKADFSAAGAIVIGISPDPPASHQRFRAKHDLRVRLASDPDLKVIRRYGLWIEKSMFGRKFMGVERATFLIDADGRISRIWRKVRVKGHVEAVLDAVKKLQQSR
jgi:peroxiredoxin Q/BCP